MRHKALSVADRLNASPFQFCHGHCSLAGREVVPMLESERIGLLVFSPLAAGNLPAGD